jgi:hypothetical protein
MPAIYNDGTLVRGSIDLTINSVVYTLLDFKRTGGKARTELDYDALGKPKAASHAEDFEQITGTIRSRTDKVAPPKFTVFTYDSKNWYIMDREESGSTAGLKEYAVTIMENISGTITAS